MKALSVVFRAAADLVVAAIAARVRRLPQFVAFTIEHLGLLIAAEEIRALVFTTVFATAACVVCALVIYVLCRLSKPEAPSAVAPAVRPHMRKVRPLNRHRVRDRRSMTPKPTGHRIMAPHSARAQIRAHRRRPAAGLHRKRKA